MKLGKISAQKPEKELIHILPQTRNIWHGVCELFHRIGKKKTTKKKFIKSSDQKRFQKRAEAYCYDKKNLIHA